MKTIISLVEANVLQQPFLVEMLADELVNLSSLARRLKPYIDSELSRDTQIGSIVMALKRFTGYLQGREKIQAKKLPYIYSDLSVRINLSIYTFDNSDTIIHAHRRLLDKLQNENNLFYTVSRGIYETSIVISMQYSSMIESVFKDEVNLFKVNNLSCITLKLTTEYADTPGLYHLIFSKLAWNGISVQEILSTTHEISILIDDNYASLAFTCIKDLFVQKQDQVPIKNGKNNKPIQPEINMFSL